MKLLLSLLFISMTVVPLNRAELPEQKVEIIFPSMSFEEFMKPEPIEPVIEEEVYDITLTRFYPNDSTGSDTCMATMCISKLQVNDKGWYTYKGKVVVAAATYACQAHCRNRDKYGPLPNDYRIYNFYDEIKFVVEGHTYTGIVLDSCGACMYHINGEALQRYDIYTVNGSASSSLLSTKNTGKIKAQLLVDKP